MKQNHGIKLLEPDDVEALIADRMSSNLWYLIVMASPMGQVMGEYIERTFYEGEANADFELIMLPGSITKQPGVPLLFALAFAKKWRAQRKDILKQAIPIAQGSAPDPDVFATPDIPAGIVAWLGSIRGTDRNT